MPETIQVRIRLSRQLDKRLKHAAVDADIPYNDLIRQLLTEGLERDRIAALREVSAAYGEVKASL